MTNEFNSVVERLQRQPGVLGVMLVGLDDGMVIAGDAGPGRQDDTAAALASSVFRRTRNAAAEAGLGDANFIRLEADQGHLCAAARGDLVIVTVASSTINLGRLRLEMLAAVEKL
ncbi:MAG TPA: roadblock/LC7 domain-containing protein [Gemmatimonadaceae bacterium]|nr:roadblock/LC7 domain-containing protein [Gemmatimonadaceae bacterium]